MQEKFCRHSRGILMLTKKHNYISTCLMEEFAIISRIYLEKADILLIENKVND